MNKISLSILIAIIFFVPNLIKSQCLYSEQEPVLNSSFYYPIKNNISWFSPQIIDFSSFDSVSFQRTMLNINKNGMFILGSWATINILSGFYFRQTTTLDALKYFHQANAYWNCFNLGLSAFGLYSYAKSYNKNYSTNEILLKLHNYEKIYLFNAGLDVGYYFLGRYLNEKADNSSNTSLLSGYGTSIMLQAAFLFVFDMSMYLIHNRHARKTLYKSLKI